MLAAGTGVGASLVNRQGAERLPGTGEPLSPPLQPRSPCHTPPTADFFVHPF